MINKTQYLKNFGGFKNFTWGNLWIDFKELRFMHKHWKFIVLFISVSLSLKLSAQINCRNFNLVGKWAVCLPQEPSEPCKKGIVTYTFKEDGTFKLSGVKVNYADSVVFDGTWTFQNNILIFECDYKLNTKSIKQINKIVFLNSERFYTMDEPLQGWKHYKLFQKVN